MSKARNIADLGSNDVLDTSSSGIDVTGVITADDSVTIQGTQPFYRLVDSDGPDQSNIIQSGTHLYIDNDSTGAIRLRTGSNSERVYIGSNGDIYFRKSDATTPGLFWDGTNDRLIVGNVGDDDRNTLAVIGDDVSAKLSNSEALYNWSGNAFMRLGNLDDVDGNPETGIIFRAKASSAGTGVLYFRRDGSYTGDLIFRSRLGTGTTNDEFFRIGSGVNGAVFNENGSAQDFRIESDANQDMFFLDGSANKIGIRESNPAHTIHISGQGSQIGFGSADASDGGPHGLAFYDDSTGGAGVGMHLFYRTGNEAISIENGGQVQMATFGKDGTAVFNQAGLATGDFRVETDNEEYGFFVNAGTGEVSVNTSDNSFGSFQVKQNGGADEDGIAVWNATSNRSVRMWADDSGNAYLYSGDGGTNPLYLNGGAGADTYIQNGVYIGGTASANRMSDYEYGSFTVTTTRDGITNNSGTITGRYVKVGRLVHVSIYTDIFITHTGVSYTSGQTFRFTSNLPFTPNARGGSQVAHTRTLAQSNELAVCWEKNSSVLYLNRAGASNSYNVSHNATTLNSQSNITLVWSGSYYTES